MTSNCILAILMLNTVSAAPPQQIKPDDVVILEQKNNFNGIDPWKWSYNTSDGQAHEESGALTADGKSVKMQGSYSWTSPEGITFTVTYTADDRGFVPTVTKQETGGSIEVMKPILNGSHGKPEVDDRGFVPTTTQQGKVDPTEVMKSLLNEGHAKSEVDDRGFVPTIIQQGTGGPIEVMKPPLDGGMAKLEAEHTTEQPEQPKRSSGLGVILGGLLLWALIG